MYDMILVKINNAFSQEGKKVLTSFLKGCVMSLVNQKLDKSLMDSVK